MQRRGFLTSLIALAVTPAIAKRMLPEQTRLVLLHGMHNYAIRTPREVVVLRRNMVIDFYDGDQWPPKNVGRLEPWGPASP